MINFQTESLALKCRMFAGLCLISAAYIIYIFVTMNTPLIIMVWQNYDDNLFINLGKHLASGHWLGRYSQFTLMKGPGYPAFLAASYLSGLPLTFTQAMLYCIAILLISIVTFKITKSWLLVTSLSLAALLNPKLFETARVLRDAIYVSQSILIISLFTYCIFVADDRRSRMRSAIATGILLGWYWLTREEGVWLLPGLAFLATYALLRKRALKLPSDLARPLLVMLVVFVTTQIIFSTINLFHYGKFVGVDFKEKNFQNALSAMESVQVAKPISFVNVPRQARMEIYAVSPTFAKLKPDLDPSTSKSPWEAGGCLFRSISCGDISNGFFMWALRDAVQKVGGYESPQTAAAMYASIAHEIETACIDRRLQCTAKYIPYMPRMTAYQLHEIPKSVDTLLHDIMHPGTDPTPDLSTVTGTTAEFESAVNFLNNPTHYSLSTRLSTSVEIRGWYYKPNAGNDWFNITVNDQEHSNLPYSLLRTASPDLILSKHDNLASQQRFALNAQCGGNCVLRFNFEDGSYTDVKIGQPKIFAPQFFSIGSAVLAFDSETISSDNVIDSDKRIGIASKIRKNLYAIYNFAQPTLLYLGIIAFIMSGFIIIRKRTYPIIYALAGACWISIIVRCIILVLIDASSFPAMITPYLLPIYILTIIASILSLGAAGMVIRRPTAPYHE